MGVLCHITQYLLHYFMCSLLWFLVFESRCLFDTDLCLQEQILINGAIAGWCMGHTVRL